jgi:hypothetical protein
LKGYLHTYTIRHVQHNTQKIGSILILVLCRTTQLPLKASDGVNTLKGYLHGVEHGIIRHYEPKARINPNCVAWCHDKISLFV